MGSWKWGIMRELTVGFAAIILFGALLLMLPVSNRSGVSIPFINALFTATSATCVTGLVVYDTWTQFTLFGQVVILLLIQCGGLGFMTVAIVFSFASGRKIGLRERSFLTESMNAGQLGGVVRLVHRIIFGTILVEGTGMLLMSLCFIPEFGVARGIWYSIFHSVSAFCNAGFDILGSKYPGMSLTGYASNPIIILTVCFLILIGGIGFIVWSDLVDRRFSFKELKLHSRVAILSTVIITVIGTLLFMFLEAHVLFKGKSFGQSLLDSFFLSVTPRTAGFAICDNDLLTGGSKLLTMILMMIGASPGGTGGGVKTTTVVVALSAVWTQIHNQNDVNVGKYRVDESTQKQAFCGLFIYLTLALTGIFILCIQGIDPTRAAYECLSAIGTVGLSTGITPHLPVLSKTVLIILMYLGRVGSLTVFMAMSKRGIGSKLRQPVGNVVVG
jgi:trk system potassium uptake protein TrkH